MRLQSTLSSWTLLASTHTVPMRQGRTPQPTFLRRALPSRRPHLRAPEGSSLHPRGLRSPLASGKHPAKQRPTAPTCNPPVLPPPPPRKQTRCRSAPARPSLGAHRGPEATRRCPREGRAGTGRSHARPRRTLPMPGRNTPRGPGPRGAAPSPLSAPHPGTRAPATRAARGSASSRRRSLPASARFQGARRSRRSGPGAPRPLAPAGNTPPRRQRSTPKTARAGAPARPQPPPRHPRAGTGRPPPASQGVCHE